MQTTEQENLKTFDELGLSQKLLKSIKEAGYKDPTKIQSLAIPQILQRKDVIGLSQTGTGKTASFVLPMVCLLESGRARARMPRSLILEPTRELAAQVRDSINKYCKEIKLNLALLIGGESIDNQARKLTAGVDILIATPGRLIDHIKRGNLLLNSIEILVIDEADRMLDMGFISDIEKIMETLPSNPLTLLFSATMPAPIKKLSAKYLKNPVTIEATQQSTAAETIKQIWIKSSDGFENKKKVLLTLLNREKSQIINSIIFCNRKTDGNKINKWLVENNFSSAVLHGDIHQHVRTRTLSKFKKGDIQLLVATDIAARGLDIADVGYVFNFDLPQNKEDYIHRIGRTGRAGKLGKAFNIATSEDSVKTKEIEKMTGSKIKWTNLSIPAPQKNSSPKNEKPPKPIKNEPTIGFGDHLPQFILNSINSDK